MTVELATKMVQAGTLLTLIITTWIFVCSDKGERKKEN